MALFLAVVFFDCLFCFSADCFLFHLGLQLPSEKVLVVFVFLWLFIFQFFNHIYFYGSILMWFLFAAFVSCFFASCFFLLVSEESALSKVDF